MDLEIIWSDFAEKQLDSIFEYYQVKASKSVANRLVRNIINEPQRLKKDPFIGQEENLLKERKTSYRYLIFNNYKIIYSVDEVKRVIQIADVFDTRQNPTRIDRIK